MNYFLMLIILVIGAGAYYEYTTQQETILTDIQQINDLTDKVASLQSENKKLTDNQTQVVKSLSDAQAKITDLTTQLQTAQQAAPKPAETPAPTNPAPEASTPAVPRTNDLGTIVAKDGRTFQNCQLLAVEVDGITFNHAKGITKVLFPALPSDLQKRFGYDPLKAAALTEAEIKYQDEKRKASVAPGR